MGKNVGWLLGLRVGFVDGIVVGSIDGICVGMIVGAIEQGSTTCIIKEEKHSTNKYYGVAPPSHQNQEQRN